MSDTRCRWCGLWLEVTRVGDGYPFCNRNCGNASKALHAQVRAGGSSQDP